MLSLRFCYKLFKTSNCPSGLAHSHGQVIATSEGVAALHTEGVAASVKAPPAHLLQAVAPPPHPVLVCLPPLLLTS